MVILPRVPSLVAPFTREAERLLRAPGHFNWSTVTLLALVVYVYAVEVERANWSAVLAGLASAFFTGTTGGGTSRASP
jgi:hypothetical protein